MAAIKVSRNPNNDDNRTLNLKSDQNITLGILYGLWDSIRGMTLVLHIDDEVNRQNAELEQRQLRRNDRDRYERARRSPSPVPSSAAAMIREEYAKQAEENADERSLQKMLSKKSAAAKEEQPQG